MATFEEKNHPINNIRTILLLMVNKELASLKKVNKTKINSKKLDEVEDYYSATTNLFIELKEENFNSNFVSKDVIQNKNFKKNISFKSPDSHNTNFIREIRMSNKNLQNLNSKYKPGVDFDECISPSEYDIKKFGIRADISSKKNHYFKMKTLKFNSEELFLIKKNSKTKVDTNLDEHRCEKNKNSGIDKKHPNWTFINFHSNNSEFKKNKTEIGYTYLQKLAKSLKIIKKKKKSIYDFEEMTKAINVNDHKEVNVSFSKRVSLNTARESLKNDLLAKEWVYSLTQTDDNKRKNSSQKIYFDFNSVKKNYNPNKEFSLNLVTGNENENHDEIEKFKLKKIKSEGKVDRLRKNKKYSFGLTEDKTYVTNTSLIKLTECENINKNKFIKNIVQKKVSTSSIKINTLSLSENNKKNDKFESTVSIAEIKNNSSNCQSNNNYLNQNNSSKLEESSLTQNSINTSSENSNNIILINAAESFKSLKENNLNDKFENQEDFKHEINDSNPIVKLLNENKINNDHLYFSGKIIFLNLEITDCPRTEQIPNLINIEKRGSKFHHIDKMNVLNYDNEKLSFDENILNQEKLTFIPDTPIEEENIGYSKIEIKSSKKSKNCLKSSDSNSGDSDIIQNRSFLLNQASDIENSKDSNKKNIEQTNNKYYKIKEIDFLNSLEIKKKKKKGNSNSEQNSKKKKNYLHSTDTSSFIQLKKMQNEERSNSKEKVNQSKVINLFSNESDDICLSNPNSNENNFNECQVKASNEIITLKKIPISPRYNDSKSGKFKNNSKVFKLLRCNTQEDINDSEDEISYHYKKTENASFNVDSSPKKTNSDNYNSTEKCNSKNYCLYSDKFSKKPEYVSTKLKHRNTFNYDSSQLESNKNSEGNLNAKRKKIKCLKKEETFEVNNIKTEIDDFMEETAKNILLFFNDSFENTNLKNRFSLNIKNKFAPANLFKDDENDNQISLIGIKTEKTSDNKNYSIIKSSSQSKKLNNSGLMKVENADFKIKLHECVTSKKNNQL